MPRRRRIYGALGPRRGGGDPSFANVVLLLHGEGTNGGTTFTDSSSKLRTPFSTGTWTTSTSQQVFGSASLSANSGSLQYADSADFTLGTGDFTVELRARFTANSTRYFLVGQSNSLGQDANTSFFVERTAAGKIRAVVFGTGGGTILADITSTTTVNSTGTWYYIAFGRQGTTFRLFVDAVANGTATSSATVNDSANRFAVGGLGEFASNVFSGFIDEFRFTVGTYRDIASIGIPTAAYPDF